MYRIKYSLGTYIKKIKMKILVTGSAGFIGSHIVKALLKDNHYVVGIDNLNDYYDISLKNLRLNRLEDYSVDSGFNNNYFFVKMDLCEKEKINSLFKKNNFDVVINLAAQAGVRYSIDHPDKYISSNLVGFMNILEASRNNKINHLIFASSSSVYGMNIKQPFSTDDNTDFPISLYAATKKSNELLAHSYSHLYGIRTTGVRFFTVYGPYGRPDMAYFKFTEAIDSGKPIDVYNSGKMKRDFTYIDDIVEGLTMMVNKPPTIKEKKISGSDAKFRIFNIGNNKPIELSRFIKAIESSLGKKADINMLPMQPGDVPITFADIDDLEKEYGFLPKTSIEEGIKHFVEWYKNYKRNKD